jgi:hypothetical protein
METADVTLLDSNLEKLEYSICMGRRVIAKIKQNVAFSLGVKFVVLVFALAGRTSLWAAILSDVGAMILVTLNAMLLLPARQRENDVAMLKGDIEQASKDRPVMSRDISDTESDDDACLSSKIKVKSKESGCCSSDSCGGARKAAQESASQPHEHSHGHAAGHGESTSTSLQHEHSHGHATSHDDSIAQTTSGRCSHNESTSLQHEHGHGHAEGHDDDPHAQHDAGSCSEKENPSTF